MGKNQYKALTSDADNGGNQISREKAETNIVLAHKLVLAVDLLDLTGIFVMNGFDVLKLLFEHLARYIMLPVAALASIFITVFSWFEFGLSKDKDLKGYLLGKAVTETVGAGAVNAAVIGALVSAAFTIGPYLFVAALASKALFHFGAACYFSYKTTTSKDKESRKKFRHKMIDTWAGFVVGAFATATVVVVIIFMQSAFWAMGAAAVLMGAAFALYRAGENIYNRRKKNMATPPTDDQDNNTSPDKSLDPEHRQKDIYTPDDPTSDAWGHISGNTSTKSTIANEGSVNKDTEVKDCDLPTTLTATNLSFFTEDNIKAKASTTALQQKQSAYSKTSTPRRHDELFTGVQGIRDARECSRPGSRSDHRRSVR